MPMPTYTYPSGEPKTYFADYETEPIGRGNPYYRCIHCKRSAPEINGRIDGHTDGCKYRTAMETGQPYEPFAEK